MAETPALYDELADWWPLLSAPEDYAEEAQEYRRLILEASGGGARDVLELGSGGGNNASHLKASFRMTLVDLSPAMLDVSCRLNPECEHVRGDMRSIRLGRTFDAVFVHDAIAYMTSEDDLRGVFATAFEHCRPGGVALFVPDEVRETFESATGHGGHDAPDRGLRYLEWTTDPNPADTWYLTDYAFLLRLPDGSIDVRSDRHVCGLFPRATWLGLIQGAGFEASATALTHEGRPMGAEAFVGLRPR
ncbi:MAG TPA: class I SAM-dependent methyltransferase [Actinomycetota bacterium]|nr:class I SAM-dependent methyltransferase [Actinomycetota bacterium]